jgi:hypothetical protein
MDRTVRKVARDAVHVGDLVFQTRQEFGTDFFGCSLSQQRTANETLWI